MGDFSDVSPCFTQAFGGGEPTLAVPERRAALWWPWVCFQFPGYVLLLAPRKPWTFPAEIEHHFMNMDGHEISLPPSNHPK